MPFATKLDFPASVHADILAALTRHDDEVITENIERAEDEVKAYLNGRYDVTTDFGKAGAERNKLLLRIVVTIALYYIYQAHNPRKLTQVMVDEFNRYIEMLEGIQAGRVNPVGLTPASTQSGNTASSGMPVQWGSVPQSNDIW